MGSLGNKSSKISAIIALTITGSLGLSLSGCSFPIADKKTPTNTVTASDVPTQNPSFTPAPTPTEIVITADPAGNNTQCETILAPQDLYEFNPDLALIPDVKLGLSTETLAIAQLSGISCQISNLSQNTDIEVSVVKLTPQSATAKEQQLASNTALVPQPVGTDVTAYFSATNGVGELQFVANNYWVAVASTTFTNSLDATSIAGIVKKNIGS